MPDNDTSFQHPGVAAVFDEYPSAVQTRLLELRSLILDVAANTDGVGTLEETLKWRQPSYLSSKPRIGTTIRIDQLRSSSDSFAMFFHCQTNLVDTFREMFGDLFTYEGNRALHFDVEQELPESELRECIAMALTYHSRKRS